MNVLIKLMDSARAASGTATGGLGEQELPAGCTCPRFKFRVVHGLRGPWPWLPGRVEVPPASGQPA
jgi:hypothetical protein